ncbi:actin family [Jimgerdemannia flammicorona]|uniref:Actin family n=1 Tax=Jimgerdemannia flammicorona TaxID=994334 RepID=A0A433DI52_9FUNG|nr:actin family [Jimgerdemannia flammicorona]
MSFTLREENFVVIDNGSYEIKAGMGVHDTNQPPSVVYQTSQIGTPLKCERINNWEELETLWYRLVSTLPSLHPRFPKKLFFSSFQYSRTIRRQILFKELPIKKTRNESPVLLSVPTSWTKEEYERITQIFFESFNVPGLYVAEQPLMSLYGCGSVSGVVIDIGHETTNVTSIVDSLIVYHSIQTLDVAGREADEHLLAHLRADEQLRAEFGDDVDTLLDLEFARFVKEAPGVCDVSVGYEVEMATEESKEVVPGVAAVAAAAPPTTQVPVIPPMERAELEYNGRKVTIGSYRHSLYNPIFDPTLIGRTTLTGLAEAIKLSVMTCEPAEIRLRLWENLVVTGGGALIAGIKERIKAELLPYLPVSDNAGDTQSRDIKFLRIPDYFTVLREPHFQRFSAWLGGEIVAKLVFPNPTNYISKVDYNESGPSVVHHKSY